jgi:hypothetical protein
MQHKSLDVAIRGRFQRLTELFHIIISAWPIDVLELDSLSASTATNFWIMLLPHGVSAKARHATVPFNRLKYQRA